MKKLQIQSYFKFCQQYWLQYSWDKVSMEGSDDLHSKDEAATVILLHSRPQSLHRGVNCKKKAPCV